MRIEGRRRSEDTTRTDSDRSQRQFEFKRGVDSVIPESVRAGGDWEPVRVRLFPINSGSEIIETTAVPEDHHFII